ncbi:MAG: hypothetical protein KAJ39_05045 [Gammaproteobacteria bacterium]|nr:hypothetical protein [Gammaproteobacteria bacterium]
MGFKFKCAWCGEIIDLGGDEANWYENQKEFVNDNGELEVWAKVQHISKKLDPKFPGYHACGETNYLIFKGKLEQIIKREY